MSSQIIHNAAITQRQAIQLAERYVNEDREVFLNAENAVFLPAGANGNSGDKDVWLVYFDLKIPIDPGHIMIYVDAQTGKVEPMIFP
jgi:hypothetical protein